MHDTRIGVILLAEFTWSIRLFNFVLEHGVVISAAYHGELGNVLEVMELERCSAG